MLWIKLIHFNYEHVAQFHIFHNFVYIRHITQTIFPQLICYFDFSTRAVKRFRLLLFKSVQFSKLLNFDYQYVV